MFFRLTIITTFLASLLFAATPANANPAVITALTTPTMAVEMQGADPEMQKQIACTALAVYHEALNQGERGQIAVIHVILNRIKSGRFADTPCGVVFQRGQFSFIHYPWKRLIPPANANWNAIVRLVQTVQSGIADPTSGALYFYNPRLARPAWRHAQSTVRIGAHVFVRA